MLPITNATLKEVIRGQVSVSDAPVYDDFDNGRPDVVDQDDIVAVWSGAASAYLEQRRVRRNLTQTTDKVTETKIAIDKVYAVQADDTLLVEYLGEEHYYQVSAVTDNPPFFALECEVKSR